jgi:hypothetical protein
VLRTIVVTFSAMYRAPLLLFLLSATSGCYGYAPIEAGAPLPDPGSSVRIHLSPARSFELGEVTANNIAIVDGEVARWDEERLVLWPSSLRSSTGVKHRGVGQSVHILRNSIATTEGRQLSAGRTGGIVAVGVLAGVLAVALFGGDAGGAQGPGNGPPSGN